VAHIVKRCSRCRRRVPAGARTCECGGRVRWMARYIDPDGIEKAQTFARQQDAEDFLEAIEAAKDRGEYLDPKAGREMLDSVYARFMKQANLSPTTRAKWEGIWTRYVKPRLGSTKVSSITKNAVIETMNAPESPWQGNEALKLTKRLLYFAMDDGILSRNVAARIEPRKVERRQIEILEPDELNAVLAHLGERWRAMVLLDALGSLRWSELVGLRRQDVDLEARTVTISQKVTEVDGRFHFGPPKTAGSARTVDLPDVVVKPLAEHLLRYPGELVFHGRGGNPIRRKVFRAAWFKAIKDAEITKHVRPGWLRHSGASLAYAASHDLKLVSKRLGHSSTRMVDSVYLKLYEDADRKVADAIDELLRASAARKTDH
jgi:integrase